jgi:hypothetical protein
MKEVKPPDNVLGVIREFTFFDGQGMRRYFQDGRVSTCFFGKWKNDERVDIIVTYYPPGRSRRLWEVEIHQINAQSRRVWNRLFGIGDTRKEAFADLRRHIAEMRRLVSPFR